MLRRWIKSWAAAYIYQRDWATAAWAKWTFPWSMYTQDQQRWSSVQVGCMQQLWMVSWRESAQRQDCFLQQHRKSYRCAAGKEPSSNFLSALAMTLSESPSPSIIVQHFISCQGNEYLFQFHQQLLLANIHSLRAGASLAKRLSPRKPLGPESGRSLTLASDVNASSSQAPRFACIPRN